MKYLPDSNTCIRFLNHRSQVLEPEELQDAAHRKAILDELTAETQKLRLGS